MNHHVSKELLGKARKAASPAELAALASESGMELDQAGAEELFAKLHRVDGGLSDSELDAVSGGGCGGSSGGGSDDSCSGYGLSGGEQVHVTIGELCECGGDNFEILYCCGGYGTATERYMTKCLACGREMGHWAYELTRI